jgi:hypothetical protein
MAVARSTGANGILAAIPALDRHAAYSFKADLAVVI